MPIKLFLQIVRWPNLLTIILTQAILWWVSRPLGLLLPDRFFWVLCIGTVLIAAAGYIINDIYDLATDRINCPHRVWLDIHLTRKAALCLYISTNITALLLALSSLNIALVLCFLGAIVLLLGYAKYFKKMLLTGNLVVAFLCALVVLQFWYFYRSSLSEFWNDVLLFYALFAFYATLAREIVKDIEDRKGDEQTACKTLAIVYGNRMAEYAVISCAAILIGLLLFVLYIYLPNHVIFVQIYGLVALIGPLLWLTSYLLRCKSYCTYRQISQFLKAYLMLGLFFLVFIRTVFF